MATVRIERRSNKAFTLIIDHGIDPITKKRKKEARTIQTDDEEVAEIERLKILTDLAKKTYKPTNKVTLKEYIEYWFGTPTAKKLASKTLESYKNCAEKRIIPWIGNIKVRELTRDDLYKFYQHMIEVGHLDNLKPPLPPKNGGKPEPRKRKEISKEVILYHHRFISRLLNYAIYEDRILEQNVALKMELPDPVQPEGYNPDEEDTVKVFSQDEILKLEAAAADNPKAAPYMNLIAVALRTGMRREELLALRWEDVDFKNHTIMVRRALVHTQLNGYEFKSTKNKKRRLIEVTDEVLNAFRAEARRQAPYKLRLKDKYNKKNKLIFCREDGVQSHPDTISSWFPDFCKSIGITRLGFHCLRHTHASHLLATGEDISYVSKRLGHSSMQVTYDKYFHFIPHEKRESLKELDKKFNKK
ncbi:tyrosine-type recombinase/integrase [Sporomusa paucivorans]|uniref:tyrosine-type recombinase/integrase n=1 Tax=Sporomusa paucivorans TaxID=2376 RepID=UPI003570C227